MATTQMEVSELQRLLAHENLERLSGLEPPTKLPPGKGPFDDDPSGSRGLKVLQKWSRDNKTTLQTAIQAQAYGGKSPIK